jgi:hypothetical protein
VQKVDTELLFSFLWIIPTQYLYVFLISIGHS